MAIAREVGDPALLARALTAQGFTANLGIDVEVARACFAEAIGLARAVDDQWRLSQILAEQARGAHVGGDWLAMRVAGEEGRTGGGASARDATRLFGAAHAIRQRIGEIRPKVDDAGYEASVAVLRDALGEKEFDAA